MNLHILRYLLTASLIISSIYSSNQVHAEDVPFRGSQTLKTMPFSYSSIFSYYAAFKEQPLLSWREANDNVGAIGGWRFYAREGQKPAEQIPPFGLMFDTGSAPLPLTPFTPGNHIHNDGGKR